MCTYALLCVFPCACACVRAHSYLLCGLFLRYYPMPAARPFFKAFMPFLLPYAMGWAWGACSSPVCVHALCFGYWLASSNLFFTYGCLKGINGPAVLLSQVVCRGFERY